MHIYQVWRVIILFGEISEFLVFRGVLIFYILSIESNYEIPDINNSIIFLIIRLQISNLHTRVTLDFSFQAYTPFLTEL